jgi:hypothetical protein
MGRKYNLPPSTQPLRGIAKYIVLVIKMHGETTSGCENTLAKTVWTLVLVGTNIGVLNVGATNRSCTHEADNEPVPAQWKCICGGMVRAETKRKHWVITY